MLKYLQIAIEIITEKPRRDGIKAIAFNILLKYPYLKMILQSNDNFLVIEVEVDILIVTFKALYPALTSRG